MMESNKIKRIVLIVAGIFIFFLILLGVTILESLKSREVLDRESFPTPTLVEINRQQTPLVERYEKEGSKKLLNYLKTRPTPSLPSDSQTKARLIKEIPGGSTIITSNATFKIEYVEGPETFEVEIKTVEFDKAKNEAVGFLKSQGFSEEGICKLPVVFYLNYEVSLEMATGAKKLNPIPDFCL